jgi:hypothetical protein
MEPRIQYAQTADGVSIACASCRRNGVVRHEREQRFI